jgi:hypothetical protein
MRNYTGTDNRDPDAIQKIDYFLRDVAAAMGRIEKGQVPSGGGGTIIVAGGGGDHGGLTGLSDDDHAQYALLAGRYGGQTLYGSTPQVYGTLALFGCPLTTNGANDHTGHVHIGNGIQLSDGYNGTDLVSVGVSLGLTDSHCHTVFLRPNGTGTASEIDIAGEALEFRSASFTLGHTAQNNYDNTRAMLTLFPKAAFTNSYLACLDPTTSVAIASINHDGKFVGDGSLLTGIGTTAGVVTLAGAQTITGPKTFPPDGTNAPVFGGSVGSLYPALKLVDDPETAPTYLFVYPSTDSGNLYSHPGTMMTTGSTGTMGRLGAGLLKNSGATGLVTIATKADLPGHDHTATGEGGVIDYATEEYVNNAVAQVINVASGRTLTVGTETYGTYASTHVHDNAPWRVREAAATPGLNVELTFGATTAIAKAPTSLWLRAYHNGEHTVTVSIYKYTTAAWESYQVLPSEQAGYTFYSIPIPDGADHISAGLARVQFAYTGEGSLDDYLYVEYCALVKGGQGSETVDATRTWTTKQTFPSDAYAPEMGKIELGHATDTTLTRTGAGDIAVEGNHVYRAGGTDVAVADGGTGASTLAGAGIATMVGTPCNEIGRTTSIDGGGHILLAGPHAAGMYRVNLYLECTTAGTTGAKIYVEILTGGLADPEGEGVYSFTCGMVRGGTGLMVKDCVLTGTFIYYLSSIPFYSNGGSAGYDTILFTTLTDTGDPAYTLRARLEYLGA